MFNNTTPTETISYEDATQVIAELCAAHYQLRTLWAYALAVDKISTIEDIRNAADGYTDLDEFRNDAPGHILYISKKVVALAIDGIESDFGLDL